MPSAMQFLSDGRFPQTGGVKRLPQLGSGGRTNLL